MTLKAKDPVKVVTIRGTSFESAESAGGDTKIEPASAGEYNSSVSQFVSQELTKSDRPELTAAKVIVSGGMI